MVFLCDIDGTLASLTPEQNKFLEAKWRADKESAHLNWDDHYYKYLSKQAPIKKNIKLAECFWASDFMFFFVTARNEKYREETIKWLQKNICHHRVEDGLKMRPIGDRRESFLVKSDLFKKIKKNFPTHEFLVFEDDPDCIGMYRNEGCYIIRDPVF